MKTTDGFQQTYNAQAAVEIQSRLVVSTAVSDAPNDKEQLVPTLDCVSPVVESIGAVLIDSGFYSEAAVAAAEQSREGAPPPVVYASAKQIMAHRLATQAGRKLYAQRKQTIEPVFGIIKETMGFRRFRLRGLAKVRLEWTLVTLAYNPQRLFRLGADLAAA
jgi:hypothetical protein